MEDTFVYIARTYKEAEEYAKKLAKKKKEVYIFQPIYERTNGFYVTDSPINTSSTLKLGIVKYNGDDFHIAKYKYVEKSWLLIINSTVRDYGIGVEHFKKELTSEYNQKDRIFIEYLRQELSSREAIEFWVIASNEEECDKIFEQEKTSGCLKTFDICKEGLKSCVNLYDVTY